MKKRNRKNKTKQEENPKGRVMNSDAASAAGKSKKDTEMLIYMWFLDHVGEDYGHNLNLNFERSI